MRRRYLSRIALFGALLLGCSAGERASASSSVLGDQGEVYSLVQTTLGSVVPGTPPEQAARPALALETRAGTSVTRVLVPSTEDAATETFANLVYERSARAVYAVWQGNIGIHPVIYLASYAAAGWTNPIMVSGDAFSRKFAPRLVVSRDWAGDGAERIERTVLHVVYAQEDADGLVSTHYAPVILHKGVYAGPHAIYRLNDLLPAATPPAYALSPILLRRPTLRAGVDGQSAVAAFVDGPTGRIVSVEIAVLPLQISRVAGEARAQVIIVGSRSFGAKGSAERAAFSADLRAAVRAAALAQGFNSSVANTLADSVDQAAQAEPGSDDAALQRVAAEARAQVIIVGVRGRNHGLESNALAEAHVTFDSGDGVGEEDTHFVLASQLLAPRTGAELENEIFVAADGQRTLVSWTDGARFLRYRESGAETGDAWSDVLEIKLSTEFSREQARQILDSKVN